MCWCFYSDICCEVFIDSIMAHLLCSSVSVAAVLCLACEDVVLGYECVGVFIVVAVVKRSV